ncbi:MAG TPA: hypothetical protein VHK27_01600, partial [Gammaproteobacteria bacterium]|nr:hypothetical protein [Gammaproteobacteria bacterium]
MRLRTRMQRLEAWINQARSLEDLSDAELATIVAEGTPYTAQEILDMDRAAEAAFLEERGLGWILDASDAELEA